MPVFDIYQELRAVVTALNSAVVHYALCGGLALAVHAEPRATKDLVLVNDLLRAAWEARERVQWADQQLWVVSRDGLIAMKRMAGRPQELADIQRLEGGDGG